MLVTLPNRRVLVRVAARHAVPRVVAQLLDAQRDAVLLGVELQHLGLQFLADLHHFARVAHTAPGHVGDVQQAVDAAEVDEGTVLGDVLDHAVDDRAFVQRLQQLGALFAHRSLDHRAARQHDVVALAVELDDLELHGLALERAHVLDRTRVEQGARQEGADAVDQHRQAALDLAVDGAVRRTRRIPARSRATSTRPGAWPCRATGWCRRSRFRRASMATETKSPTWTSSSPWSFLNSSIGT